MMYDVCTTRYNQYNYTLHWYIKGLSDVVWTLSRTQKQRHKRTPQFFSKLKKF